MPADVVFRVGRAYGMTADRGVYQAVAVSGGRITAAERSRDDLDPLSGSAPRPAGDCCAKTTAWASLRRAANAASIRSAL
jgi:hypothetical protein